MESHYTYLTSLGIHDANHQKILTAVVFGLALLLIGSQSARKLSRRRALKGDHEGAIPEEKITTSGIFDFFIESFVAFQDSILGRINHANHHTGPRKCLK